MQSLSCWEVTYIKKVAGYCQVKNVMTVPLAISWNAGHCFGSYSSYLNTNIDCLTPVPAYISFHELKLDRIRQASLVDRSWTCRGHFLYKSLQKYSVKNFNGWEDIQNIQKISIAVRLRYHFSTFMFWHNFWTLNFVFHSSCH